MIIKVEIADVDGGSGTFVFDDHSSVKFDINKLPEFSNRVLKASEIFKSKPKSNVDDLDERVRKSIFLDRAYGK